MPSAATSWRARRISSSGRILGCCGAGRRCSASSIRTLCAARRRICRGVTSWEHRRLSCLRGLAATADYFVWLGEQVGGSGSRESRIKAAYSAATAYEMPIAQRLIDGLASIEGVQLQGISDSRLLSHRVPTVSFTHTRHRSSALAKALAAHGINVWSGHNYALEVVRHLGLDEHEGVLRIGLAHYNTLEEIDAVIGSLKALLA